MENIIPKGVAQFKNLETLYFYNNKIEEIPDFLIK